MVTSSWVSMSSTVMELGSWPSATTLAMMSRSVTIYGTIPFDDRQRPLLLLDHPLGRLDYACRRLNRHHFGSHCVSYLRHSYRSPFGVAHLRAPYPRYTSLTPPLYGSAVSEHGPTRQFGGGR